LVKLNDRFSLFAAVSRSFRSPTLNELYRAFRVGNVVTQANADLAAETAVNVEGGVLYGRARTFIRTNIFTANVRDTVANVTLTVTPTLITRQRQNAAKTRSSGFEIEAERRFESFGVTAGYLFAASTIRSFPSDPNLIGRRVPQVARHQFTFQTRYSPGRWSLAAQLRASSSQFDDDLNQFRLEPFGQLDLFASRALAEHVRIFAAIENITNSRYSVGRTPIRTVSSGINGRLGFRWD
jgi:outer membrane receptor protein involved in Fe transport